jgi:fimbrial chaperone protein
MKLFIRSSLAIGFANLIALSAIFNLPSTAFSVFPIKVYFGRGLSSRDVTLDNQEDTTVRLKVTAYKWAEDGEGKRQLTPTKDIALFPSILELKPNSKRIIRLTSKLPPTQSEQTYRLFVSQLPEEVTKKPEATPVGSEPKPTKATAQFNILYTLDLPVFISPISIDRKSALLNPKIDTNKLSFELANQGNAHLFVSTVEITTKDAAGKTIVTKRTPLTYVLPSITRKMNVDLPQEQCQKARSISIEAIGDEDIGTKTKLSQTLNVDKGVCAAKK